MCVILNLKPSHLRTIRDLRDHLIQVTADGGAEPEGRQVAWPIV